MNKEQINARALKALLMTNNIGDAPHKTQRQGKHYEVIIGIGKDNTATLTLYQEAYFELCKIVDDNTTNQKLGVNMNRRSSDIANYTCTAIGLAMAIVFVFWVVWS